MKEWRGVCVCVYMMWERERRYFLELQALTSSGTNIPSWITVQNAQKNSLNDMDMIEGLRMQTIGRDKFRTDSQNETFETSRPVSSFGLSASRLYILHKKVPLVFLSFICHFGGSHPHVARALVLWRKYSDSTGNEGRSHYCIYLMSDHELQQILKKRSYWKLCKASVSDPAFDTGISKPSEIIWRISLDWRSADEPAFQKTKQLQKTERPTRDNIVTYCTSGDKGIKQDMQIWYLMETLGEETLI